MKKLIALFLMVLSFMLTVAGCGIGGGGSSEKGENFDDELEASTGKWQLLDDEDTYFIFDGTKGVMTFSYVEDGSDKYSGTYRALYRGVGKDVLTPLSLMLSRNGRENEDWLGCYTECFKSDFTQFTVMVEEEDLGMIGYSIYTHIYRISELPYKMGTYVLEGNEFKEEGDNFKYADEYRISGGTYTAETGESFTFVMTKTRTSQLFSYKKGNEVIEGTYTIAQDKKTIYLYIEHDPFSKVTDADKDKYDTTFDINYPPDFYLRGDFSRSDCIVINDLYHHSYSPTKIEDSVWTFGTYYKN